MDNGHKRTSNLILTNEENDKQRIIDKEKLKYLINNFGAGIQVEEGICDRDATFGRADEIVCSNCCRASARSGGGLCARQQQHFAGQQYLDNQATSECRLNCHLLIERQRYNDNTNNLNRYCAENNRGLVMMKNKQQHCGGDDAHTVAMETDVNGSSCDVAAATALPNGNNCRLMTNENVVDHLKGMSLSDRRASVTPRITLTNVEDDPKYHLQQQQQQQDEAMITDEDQCNSPLSPRFLSVPKIEELGPERRPPQMVKTM